MSVETFPMTTLGAAAAAVVERLRPKRDFVAKPIAHGEIITEPGVYDMPIEHYHGNCCAGPSISSSGLRTIDAKSPAHYWDESYLNPEYDPAEDAAHYVLGRAAHTLLLGEEGFREKFVVRPDEFDSWRTKASKAWRREQLDSGKSVLEPKDIATIKAIAGALGRDPLVSQGLLNGEIERSIIWRDSETGVWLKSRPDALPVNADLVADLKTCTSAAPRDVRNSIAEYGYHMQLALVGMGMKEVLGREISDEDFVLVFVETKRPYCVNVKPVSPDAIFAGRAQLRRAIRKFAECLEKNEWPGYEDNGITASLPKYVQDRLDSERKMGLLPDVA
jgi:hypothetical protein